MWWWRKKVDLTIGPLKAADRLPIGRIFGLNYQEAQRHVVAPLDEPGFGALHAQALYVNATRALIEMGPQTLPEVKRKVPYGFGILTRLDQRVDTFSLDPAGWKDWAWINRIVVEAEWRRRGLGRALCQDLCEKARDLGFTHVACCVRPHGSEAGAFFKAMGFAKLDEFFVRGPYGGPHTRYAKDLGKAGAAGS